MAAVHGCVVAADRRAMTTAEEPKPGRNETVLAHMRNCLRKCKRTQVRHATTEKAEGIETVASLLLGLTEAVREGRARHFADIY